MGTAVSTMASPRFTEGAIEQQLDKIFLHPDFSNSHILRKFLSFVVKETLTGNANWLKEYTIALKVLEKPATFNPQKDCVVRIHAGRLRKALAHYYNDMCVEDQIIIGMPKGKYIPVFMDRHEWLQERRHQADISEHAFASVKEPVTFAILPFHCTSGNELIRSFSDTLCLQICTALSQMQQVSVLGYQVVKSMTTRNMDLKELSSMLHFNHIITGSVQHLQQTVRVNVQMINCNTAQQTWSRMLECRASAAKIFEIQDQVCADLMRQVEVLFARQ